ncbi:MAG TPA: LysR family transcriptional regulator [Rubrivivax sp.]|nr:LysR family transcriptional regulator [Rubrivivax sp.]
MSGIELPADDLILFAHIVAAGSFTRAADHTGLPKATLSRRLAELESRLGERLLQRSTRRLALTDLGAHMLEHAQRLQDEAEAALALAQHRQAVPQGTLRVSLPPEFQELSLVQVASEYTRRFPGVRLQLDLSARRVDLLADRYDLAVRAAVQLSNDATLVARRIVTLPGGLFASPDWLHRHGTPAAPAELLAHTALALVGSGGEAQPWRLTCGAEHWEGLPPRTLAANSLGLQQALAVQGLGIVGLSERFADAPVARGALVRVLPGWYLPPTVIWCVTAGRRLLPRRTTAFIDILRAVLAGEAPAPG